MFYVVSKWPMEHLQIEGRVLSCQSKPNDNIRLQKKYVMVL